MARGVFQFKYSPSKHAARRGVECVFVLWFTLAPYCMSNLITGRCPEPAAHHKAVAPCTMWPSNLTTHSCSMFGLKLFKIVLTTLYRPFRAAITNGVNDWPSSSTICWNIQKLTHKQKLNYCHLESTRTTSRVYAKWKCNWKKEFYGMSSSGFYVCKFVFKWKSCENPLI